MRNLVWISILCLSLTACKGKDTPPPTGMPAIPVIVEAPHVLDIPIFLESIGTTSPSAKQEIRPQVEGIVQTVLVSDGDWVTAGTPLIQIDPSSYKIKVREAQAQAAVDLAALEAARKKMARYQALAKKDLIAQTEWDELETEVEKKQGALELSQTKLSAAELDLDNCILRAFGAGRVGTLTAYAGMYTSKGQSDPLLTISNIDPLDVEFTLTQAEVLQLPQGPVQMEVTSLGLPGTAQAQLQGEVTFLDHHYNTATGLLLGRGSVANLNQTLRSGQSVRVKIPVHVIKGALLVPQKAIRYSPEGPYVYVVQSDQTVIVKQIVSGGDYQDKTIIQQGLEPADQVVTDGHLRLAAGVKVDVKP